MARLKPELYEIRGDVPKLTKDFMRALVGGLMLALREMGVLEETS